MGESYLFFLRQALRTNCLYVILIFLRFDNVTNTYIIIFIYNYEFSQIFIVWPQMRRLIFTTFEKVMFQSMLGQGGNKEVSFMAYFNIV